MIVLLLAACGPSTLTVSAPEGVTTYTYDLDGVACLIVAIGFAVALARGRL